VSGPEHASVWDVACCGPRPDIGDSTGSVYYLSGILAGAVAPETPIDSIRGRKVEKRLSPFCQWKASAEFWSDSTCSLCTYSNLSNVCNQLAGCCGSASVGRRRGPRQACCEHPRSILLMGFCGHRWLVLPYWGPHLQLDARSVGQGSFDRNHRRLLFPRPSSAWLRETAGRFSAEQSPAHRELVYSRGKSDQRAGTDRRRTPLTTPSPSIPLQSHVAAPAAATGRRAGLVEDPTTSSSRRQESSRPPLAISSLSGRPASRLVDGDRSRPARG
jgi:hypothetical protein